MRTRIDNNRLKTGLASGALLCLATTTSVLALTAVSSASADETCVPSPAIQATQGTPLIPGTLPVPAVTEEVMTDPGQEFIAPTDAVTERQLFVFTKNDADDPDPLANDPEFMPVPADPNSPNFDQPDNVVFNVSSSEQDTPGLGSFFVFRTVEVTPGNPGQEFIAPTFETVIVTEEIPGTDDVPATEGTDFVPAVTCDDDGGSELPVEQPVVLGESATNNGGNNNNNGNNGGNNGGGGGTEVLGAQAFANNAPAAQQSAPAAQVPTVINAGTAGEAPANPLAPAAIALFGALMGLIALRMRGGLARLGGGKA